MTATKSNVLDAALATVPIMGILRGRSERHLGSAARVLADAGLRALEFTLTTPGAAEAITAARAELGERCLVGAGTVLDERDAATALAAGAQFLVSPALCPAVIASANAAGVPVLPGVFTPTEILAAWSAGADTVKLFPSVAVGPEYLAALRQPFPALRLMPTGGVRMSNARAWLAAGALGLGLGSPLLGDTLETGDMSELASTALAWVAEVGA